MHARALPSMPRHVPIWANFVVYGPILKISNSMCISNGNLEFSDTAQLCSDLANSLPLALLRQLPEATALEPVKLPLILSGVCSLSSANYFPNPFGILPISFVVICSGLRKTLTSTDFVLLETR